MWPGRFSIYPSRSRGLYNGAGYNNNNGCCCDQGKSIVTEGELLPSSQSDTRSTQSEKKKGCPPSFPRFSLPPPFLLSLSLSGHLSTQYTYVGAAVVKTSNNRRQPNRISTHTHTQDGRFLAHVSKGKTPCVRAILLLEEEEAGKGL